MSMLRKLWTFICENKAMAANIVAILLAYGLSKSPDFAQEKDLLVDICAFLGLTGTALVRSALQKKAP